MKIIFMANTRTMAAIHSIKNKLTKCVTTM